jgi:hypothetical protein
MVAAPDHDDAAAARPRSRWRPIASVLLATAMVAWVMARVDWNAFVAQLLALRYAPYLAFMMAFVLALLTCDVVATRYVYRSTVAPVGFRELFVVRGASYLPSLVNHHIGQAWITYLLSRIHGVPLARVAGATLVSYATWGGCMLVLGAGALWAAELPVLWVLAPLVLGLAYLVVLWLRPAQLCERRLLAPLFEAGVGGHLRAMLLRAPHAAVLFVGTWVPFLFFGVEVPLASALIYVPILMVAVTLPLTPAGLGTRDALAITFFEGFVAAGTHEERLAAIAAATTTTVAAITAIDVALGVLLLPAATRLVAQKPAHAGAPGASPHAV